MSYEGWLNYLTSAEKKSVINGRVRKIFYKFPDGQLMAEEYSMDTGVIQRRAWRKCKQLMGEPEWEVEVGDLVQHINTDNNPSFDTNDENFILKEDASHPVLSKRITKKNIEWRIRNLPYPIEVYSVKAVPDKYGLEVRTTNKKYYKLIPTLELLRCGTFPDQANISIHHQYNTLIITYRKPEKLCEMDAQVLLLLKEVTTDLGDIEEMLQDLLTK